MIQDCGTCCSYWSPNPETFKGYCTFLSDKFRDHRFVREVDYFDGEECCNYKQNKVYDDTESS